MENGTSASRKTLKNDIKTLIHAGFDIILVSSKLNKCFLGDRGFETAELKPLVDAMYPRRRAPQKAI